MIPMKLDPGEAMKRRQEARLVLYCRYENDAHRTFQNEEVVTGKNLLEAQQKAAHKGWRLHSDGTSTCPVCRSYEEKGNVECPMDS